MQGYMMAMPMSNDLPEGWVSAQVKELMNLFDGFPFKPTQWSKRGLPIIRIQNLNSRDKPKDDKKDSTSKDK
jgi:hypothetical protein